MTKLVKERDQKLGRLISTMSSNYPILQVMGFKQINKNSEAELESTQMTIFEPKRDLTEPSPPRLVIGITAPTADLGKSLTKYKWTKDYLIDEPAIDLD